MSRCTCSNRDLLVTDTPEYRMGRWAGMVDALELVEFDLRDNGVLLRSLITRSALSSGRTMEEALANLDRLADDWRDARTAVDS